MTSKSVLLGGLMAPFSNSGRAKRSEFWGFMPFGVSLCVIAGIAASLLNFTFMGTVLAVVVSAFPLMVLWWRRLQDVGIWGAHAVSPLLALFVFLLCSSAAYTLQIEAANGFREARDHLFGWAIMPEILFKFVGGKWVAIFIATISLILFLFRFVFALSHAILPSVPNDNRYGPNPNEVTP